MTETPYPPRDDTSPDAVRARIAEFCEWFDVEPVKIKARKGMVYLTDDLMAWINANGASIDWIVYGRAKGMAATFRQKYARKPEEEEFLRLIGRFSTAEQEIILAGIRDFAAGRITIQELEARIAAHRRGEAVPEGMISIPIARNAAELNALIASRTADRARDVTPD